jgi:tetratricopeptide (TPR) repeat protein
MKTLPLALVVALISLRPIAARADDDPRADAVKLAEEGIALYGKRDYRAAIETFEKAYALDPDPNLLFNVARSHEKLGENARAIDRYEAFLQVPGTDAQQRVRAEESLKALRKLEADREAAAHPAPIAPAQKTQAPPPPVAPPPPAATGGSGAGLTIGGVVLVSVGGGALIGGTIAYVLGAEDHNEVTDAPNYDGVGIVAMTERRAIDLVDSGDAKKGLGIGLWVAGGACLGAGILMLTLPSGGGEGVATETASRNTIGVWGTRGGFVTGFRSTY